MPDAIDDTTAALVGHALVRWLIDEDPGSVATFVPDLDAGEVDDAKAARIGRTLVELLQRIDVA
jgi:hypothetical protein